MGKKPISWTLEFEIGLCSPGNSHFSHVGLAANKVPQTSADKV